MKTMDTFIGEYAKNDICGNIFCFPSDVELCADNENYKYSDMRDDLERNIDLARHSANSVNGHNTLTIELVERVPVPTNNGIGYAYLCRDIICFRDIDTSMFLEDRCLTRDGYVNALALYDYVHVFDDGNIDTEIIVNR